MSATQPFDPVYGSTQTLTPAAGSASVVIDTQGRVKQVRILNTGANVAYVRLGPDTVSATTADFPIAPNQASTITKFQDWTHLAHISPLGSTLIVTLGEGW